MINTIQNIKALNLEEVNRDDIKYLIDRLDVAEKNIMNAMDDDFNTPIAIAEILTLFKDLNRAIFEEKKLINDIVKTRFLKFIETIDRIFGLFPRGRARTMVDDDKRLKEKEGTINSLVDLLKNTVVLREGSGRT